MRNTILVFALITASLIAQPAAQAASATVPKRSAPSLEQRVSDLEAYVNNGTRVADGTNTVSSNLGSYDEKANVFTPNPGPGPNAWQMTCAALVLFMTLPGLALFYGGLVRRKNVLSVLAQCI
jgi:Amt family ammonium transporter